MDIPKKIHQIWVGPYEIPKESLKFIEKIKELHPTFEYRLWTDKDLTPENFSNFDMINKTNIYAQKADIMRYEILYREGGIYLDIDFELFKNIEHLLTNKLIICNETANTSQYMSIGFIASIPNHYVMKSCIENIRYSKLGTQYVNHETGPWFFRKCFDINDTSITLLPTHVMYPVYFTEETYDKNTFKEDTCGMHHWTGNWKKDLDFLEIGTSDFDTLIQTCKETEFGISVEPILYYLNKLPNIPNVTKINIALTNNKTSDFIDVYYIPEDIIYKHNLPDWFKGCNKIGEYHPLHIKHNVTDLVKIDNVKLVNIDDFLNEKNIRKIKFIKIDTEGHDLIILEGLFKYLKNKTRDYYPNKIQFETNANSNLDDVTNMIEKYVSIGYKVTQRENSDTIIELI